jgi:hypothetical protein
MPSVTIKRNVLLRSIVTEKLRADLSEELQNAADEVDQRVQQLDFQTRAYITDLQRTNLQQAMAVRKQVEAEKHRQQELRDALLERKAQVEVLEDDSEVVRGTLESFVEINVGDNLSEVLGGVEIVSKDDVVVEIRLRQITDEPEESVTQIIQDVRSQSGQ